MLTVAFIATQIPATLTVDVPELPELPTTFKTLCLPPTVGVDNVAFRVTFEKRNIISSPFGSKFPLF